MGLFDSPKIDGDMLQQCLVYFEESSKVVSFQTKEADIYNNALEKYGNSITENPFAAGEMNKAAKRLLQSVNEVVRRYENINTVPNPALFAHSAWQHTLSSCMRWATETESAIDSVSRGMEPNFFDVQKFVNEYQKSWKKAKDEDVKFLKRLNVSPEEIANIVARALSFASEDNWKPTTYIQSSTFSSTIENKQSSITQKESEIALLKDEEWRVIDGEVCRVVDFFPLMGSFVDERGEVRSPTSSFPYASITFDNKKLGNNITGYITHKIDFGNLWAAFRERGVKQNEEVVFIWTRRGYKFVVPKLTSIGMPKLYVMIWSKGAFEYFINPKYKPDITGNERLLAWKPLISWKPEVMK
jgi:hypothetical protein